MNLKSQLGAAAWGFRELDIGEQLITCKRLGLNYMELGIANAPKDIPLDATADDLKKISDLYQKYGIPLSMAATGNDFTLDSEEQIKNEVLKIKKVTDICSFLGIKYLRIFAGFAHVEEVVGDRFRSMIDAITEVADYARSKKVVLAIETHGGVNASDDGVSYYTSVTTEQEQLRKLIGEIPDDVEFVFDPANLYVVGKKHPDEFYPILKGRIAYMHMKDFIVMPNGKVKPGACGESDMDWQALLNNISDFTGPILIEYEIPDNIEEGLKKSIQYFEKLT